MRKFILLTFAFIFAYWQPSFAQANRDAIANADAFLAALKIADIPEGRKAMLDAAWGEPFQPPIVQDQKTLFEGTFDTDIPGVQGFKRLLEMKVESQGKTVLTTRYLLVSYRDRKSGVWKVFDLRASTNPETEINGAQRDLGDIRFTKDQFNYRRYAYWLTFGGKLHEAKQALLTSREKNNMHPDANFSLMEYETSMAVLVAISGE